MPSAVHDEVNATLSRLRLRDSGLSPLIERSFGYAVFPAIGHASAVLGGSHGRGEVFEHGKPIGFATMKQLTIGVQVGGETFSELILFETKDALDSFKRGKVQFAANACAVLVRAGGSGTSDFGGVTAKAYTRGGMLLGAAIGAQKFSFHPSAEAQESAEEGKAPPNPDAAGPDAAGKANAGNASAAQNIHDASDTEAPPEPAPAEPRGTKARVTTAAQNVAVVASHKAAGFLKAHPNAAKQLDQLGTKLRVSRRNVFEKLATKVLWFDDKVAFGKVVAEEAKAALQRMKEKDPGLQQLLDNAYGYAIFPRIGKATLVLGGEFGIGQVFVGQALIGYAGIVQLTIGLQVGGQTLDALIVFENEGALDRFKRSKFTFAADASAACVSAGAAATASYPAGAKVFLHSDGGLMLESAIGGQTVVFRAVPGAS